MKLTKLSLTKHPDTLKFVMVDFADKLSEMMVWTDMFKPIVGKEYAQERRGHPFWDDGMIVGRQNRSAIVDWRKLLRWLSGNKEANLILRQDVARFYIYSRFSDSAYYFMHPSKDMVDEVAEFISIDSIELTGMESFMDEHSPEDALHFSINASIDDDHKDRLDSYIDLNADDIKLRSEMLRRVNVRIRMATMKAAAPRIPYADELAQDIVDELIESGLANTEAFGT